MSVTPMYRSKFSDDKDAIFLDTYFDIDVYLHPNKQGIEALFLTVESDRDGDYGSVSVPYCFRNLLIKTKYSNVGIAFFETVELDRMRYIKAIFMALTSLMFQTLNLTKYRAMRILEKYQIDMHRVERSF